jgi:dinuclear metal center YbgI/SA1388 family protein
LQVAQFKDFCPNGLQVEGRKEIAKVATAVSCSSHIIEEAIEREADALIVHHGIFWQRDLLPIVGIKRSKIAKLLAHGISLLAYHLPLDAHRQIGNNWKAAYDLGWMDLEPFFQMDGQWIGVRGKIPRQLREDFQSSLEAYYGQKAATALGGKEKIASVALVSGGAYRQIQEASDLGLDAYVTGNFDEPAWHSAFEGKINFFAMGHAATEKIGPRAIADYLRRVLNLEAFFIDEINPF